MPKKGDTLPMTCPLCHLVNSPLSLDVCSRCGALLRGSGTGAAPADGAPRLGVAPSPTPRPRRLLSRLNRLSNLTIWLGAALLGTGTGFLVRWGQQVFSPASSPLTVAAAPMPIPMSPLQGQVAPRSFPQAIPEQYRTGSRLRPKPLETLPEMPPLAVLRPAKDVDVPLRDYAPNKISLRLSEVHPVSRAVRLEITARYNEWKQRQTDGTNQLESLIDFYAPGSRIFRVPDKAISRDDLRQLSIRTRQMGIFTSARDQKPLEWAQNAAGDRVELLAFHCYGDDGGNLLSGQRLLTWRRSGGKWLIVRDDFPPRYFVSK